MRILSRIAVLSFALGLGGCAGSTEPSTKNVDIDLLVSWPAAAEPQTLTRLTAGSAVIQVNRGAARIVDVNRAVNPALDPVPLSITVPLEGSSEQLSLLVRFHSGSETLYERTTTATLPSPNGTPIPVELAYVGPGASATQLELSAESDVVATLASVLLTATARTAVNAVVPTPVHWSVEDPLTGSVTQQGVFTAGSEPGSATVSALAANGLTAQLVLVVRGAADELQRISTEAQQAPPNAPFAPFRVRAMRDGQPTADAPVVFVTDGVEFSLPDGATVLTDEDGYAEVTAVAGPLVGEGTLTASVDGQEVVFAVEVIAGPPVQIQAGSHGVPVRYSASHTNPNPPIVVVRDNMTNGVPNVPVQFTVVMGGGTLASTEPVLTNANGVAIAPAWTPGPMYGVQSVKASTGCPGENCLEIEIAYDVGLLSADDRHFVTGAGQSGPIGSPLGIPVRFNIGDAISGVEVSVEVLSGAADLSGVVPRITNADGEIEFTVTPQSVGAIELRFTIIDTFLGNPTLSTIITGTP